MRNYLALIFVLITSGKAHAGPNVVSSGKDYKAIVKYFSDIPEIADSQIQVVQVGVDEYEVTIVTANSCAVHTLTFGYEPWLRIGYEGYHIGSHRTILNFSRVVTCPAEASARKSLG